MQIATMAVLAGTLASAVPSQAQAPPPNPTAVALAAFTQRANAYAALRKGAEKGAARLERHTRK